MYKIGEFSKISNLTIKALRYYDEQGILNSSFRGESNYRLYDQSDFKKAQLICLLRNLNFSIAEIKDILVNYEEEMDLQYYLSEKKSFIDEQIKKEKALIKSINHYLTNIKNMEVVIMNYEFEIKEIAPVKVAYIRYKCAYNGVGKYIGEIYKEVKDKANGCPFNCYFDGEFKDIADIETCVPIKKDFPCKTVKIKDLPQIKALCTTHIGRYENINLAYKAIADYATEHNIELDLPSREYYVKGPGMIFKGNPEKYITEIAIPIK